MPLQRPLLLLEDDPDTAAAMHEALTSDGWRLEMAETLAAGRATLAAANPRIVVVDLGLPDGNGIAFVQEAARRPDIGIIVVSGRSAEVDRIVGLEVGADDYLTKPFSLREMVARVRALSRRLDTVAALARPAAVPPPPGAWDIVGLRLEPTRQRIVAPDGREIRLTGGEASMLHLLLEAPENLADRASISERALGRRLLPDQRGVDQLASMLRQKLRESSRGQVTVAAVRGRGYRLAW
ncbi:response regulator transcription factor [Roseomonas stagni]|uniref:Response regulator transcription factor n=1 Tax=Falsiroseomonas algicola TaxID=2716930 RepID=A0A6M1LJ73_9PROT|nr:response regulator transcription factor [Falsiroseomonas algicola]NGM20386.1 response regulator transcription factor [Falsiroseomonas algicola]